MELTFRGPAAGCVDDLAGFCRTVADAGGRVLVVGGTVRDALLGREVDEYDLEVYGVAAADLVDLLERSYRLDRVGEAFGVIKLRDLPFEVALPRRESKRGLGHRGFEIWSDPDLPFDEASARRDFTINAMAWDPLSGELLDAHGGREDLAARVLRHVSPAFREDPLRVLRGAQFVARLELTAAPETVALCRTIGFEDLAAERVFEEFRKLLLRGVRPGDGLHFLRAVDWLRHFPEIAALVDCPQDPEWHPEGDVFVHTAHVLDAFAAERIGDPWEDLVVGVACLCHDFGKPATTEYRDGRWRSPNHEPVGEAPTRAFLGRLTPQRRLVEEVVPLVREHLKPVQLHLSGASDAAVRRLSSRVGRIDRLVRVVRADQRGRPPLEADDAACRWLLEVAERLHVQEAAPEPWLRGRDLIDRGWSPGPHFGEILRTAYEAQLDGAFDDHAGALSWLEEELARSPGSDVPGE